MSPANPIVVDCFAGGGGASMGIELALGRPVDEAINHDPEAVALHQANHPRTRHWTQNILQVDPLQVTAGRPVALAWFSPDCAHFSKAKGGRPRKKNIRDLAWVVVDWARAVRPRVIMLENVEEFRTWGPLNEDGYPIRDRMGETFREWTEQLCGLGYELDWRELRACDYGAPTIRKRLFIIARCDGQPIAWPAPSHGRDGQDLLPYRTAAECIDWLLPCPSIFERKKPLAEATLRRIANGVRRFVILTEQPFIVAMTHAGGDRTRGVDQPLTTVTGAHRGEQAIVVPTIVRMNHDGQGKPTDSIDEPLRTITTQSNKHLLVAPFLARTAYKHANGSYVHPPEEPFRTLTAQSDGLSLVSPTLIQTGYGERDGQAMRVPGLHKPLGTVVAGGVKHGLVAGFLAKHFRGATGAPAAEPLPTILSKAAQTNIVAAHLTKLYGTSDAGTTVDDPMPTVSAGGGHIAEVRAFLMHYYGQSVRQSLHAPTSAVLANDHLALVTVHGQLYEIVDIGMRMLTPRELFRAQGFPAGYIIDPTVADKRLTKTAQVRMVGNSVCPDVARALVEANVPLTTQRELWRGYEGSEQ